MKIKHLLPSALLIVLVLAGSLSAQSRPSFYEKPSAAVAAKSASGGQTFSSIPVCDSNGDYKGRSLHKYWQVVDKDRKGLTGRISKEWPANWDYVDANWPDTSNVDRWPEAAKFSPGSVLLAATGNMGIILVYDAAKKPWLLISAGVGRVCFVRANVKFVMPVSLDAKSDCVPDAQGNFSGARAIIQSHWFVTDRDPNGLNGRLSSEWPANWDAVNANWPDTAMVRAWQVVDRFKRGEVLSSAWGNRGAIMVHDAAKKPWLLVRRSNGGVCFVRANQGFISPVGMIGVAEAAKTALVEKALSLHRAGKKAEAESLITNLSRDEGFSAAERDGIIREITRVLNAESMK